MSQINLPNAKEILWHKMRDDLKALIPWFSDKDLLLCPTCCRALKYEDFSVEHIIPQQAVADDPAAAQAAIPKNERSGLTLLCKRTLVFEKKSIPGHGCNSWKGKHYDPFIRDALRLGILELKIKSRHQIAIMSAGYLGLFRKFGYQIALLPSGILMGNQFFRPNSLLDQMPTSSRMLLAGGLPDKYDEEAHEYWGHPFKISVERDAAFVVMRNFSIQLPLSRDPTVPIARSLSYAPARYRFRPDVTTAFD